MSNMHKDTLKRRQELESKYISGSILSDQEAEELRTLQKESSFASFRNDGTVAGESETKEINRLYFLAEKLSGSGALDKIEMDEYKNLVNKYKGYSSFPAEISALNILFGI